MSNVQDSVANGLAEIDRIVEGTRGRRLGKPNAVGAIAIEAMRGGIAGLAASPHVRAILEDQVASGPARRRVESPAGCLRIPEAPLAVAES